jgi:thiol-disulfide isomerase/thioredoxin
VLKNIFIQLFIFTLAFNALSWFKETSMLDLKPLAEENIMEVQTLMGKTIKLKANDKTTIVYFFAPWCKICHVSIDNLQNIYLKNQDLDVIAVALDYIDKQEIIEFNQQHQLTFPIALGNHKIKEQFKVNAYPSYYVLDKNNTIIAKSLGYSTELGLYLRTM